MNVFVVEDSAAMRQRLIAALEELPGVRVTGWSDRADNAIEAIRRLEPHFVVLDLQLVQGNGMSVLGALRALDRTPTVAILTNYTQPQYRRRCAELGADFFFDKSADLDDLLAACRAAVPEVTRR